MTDVFDIDPREAADPASLSALISKCEELEEIDNQQAALKAAIDELGDRKKQITHKELPEALNALGLEEQPLPSGGKVTKKTVVSGSLPKDPVKRKLATDHLEDIGGADMFKTVLTVSFTKGQHSQAIDLLERLKGEGFVAELENKIHPQTLYSFIREKMEKGEDFTAETLGLYIADIAQYKAPKAKK